MSFSTLQISTLTHGSEWAGTRVANLCLKALSSPGSDQPKLFTVLGDWDLEGVLVALFAEARMEPAERAPNSRQSSWQGGRRGDGQLDNSLVIICFQACQDCS